MKRAFLLLEGFPAGVHVQVALNAFAEPEERKKIEAKINIGMIQVEYTNDLIRSVAETAFSFRNASKLGTVKIGSPGSYQRKIELWAPLYYIKKIYTVTDGVSRTATRIVDQSQ